MTTERLTDEVLAELADPDGLLYWAVSPSVVAALASEVLASRNRRCGTCKHYVPYPDDLTSPCGYLEIEVPEDWFCADWAPVEPRKEDMT